MRPGRPGPYRRVMLFSADFQQLVIEEPERLPFDTFDRVWLGVLSAFPLMAAARLVGELIAWLV